MILHRQASVLGLSLEPEEVVICHLRRRGSQVKANARLRLPIPASEFKTEPDRAGQALRAGLRAARIRPERCVVCLPLSWAFTSQLELPELTEQDTQNFVRLEAERRFPLPPEDLVLCVSHRQSFEGARRASLVGVPAEALLNVATALKEARLRPTSITLGAAVLGDEQRGACSALIYLGRGFVDLAVAGDGALLAMRNLLWQQDLAQADLRTTVREIGRQLRITLAQLPAELRTPVTSAVVYGLEDWPSESSGLLAEVLAELGMSLREGALDGAPKAEGISPALLARATRELLGTHAAIELFSKRKARLHSFTARLSERNVRWMVGGTASAIVLLAASFGYQDRELARLQSQWDAMAPLVEDAKALQDRVRTYRPWYDETIPSLAIPKDLAAAFPEAGSVSLKSLHVKDRTVATCSGSASNFADLMMVKEALGKTGHLDDLKLFSARGGTPVAFTLTFRWKGNQPSGQ